MVNLCENDKQTIVVFHIIIVKKLCGKNSSPRINYLMTKGGLLFSNCQGNKFVHVKMLSYTIILYSSITDTIIYQPL